jgi:hypothetical protein
MGVETCIGNWKIRPALCGPFHTSKYQHGTILTFSSFNMDSASPFSTWLLGETFLHLEDDNNNLEDILDTVFLFGDNMEETTSRGTVNETSGNEEQTSNQDTNANDDTIIDAVEERERYVSTANDE